MRNPGFCTRKNVFYKDLPSGLAKWWSFPHSQSNKNAGNITNNNSLTPNDFIFHILVWLWAQPELDIRDDQFFQNKIQNSFFSERVEGPSDRIMSSFEAPSSFCFLKNVRLWIQWHVRNIEKNHEKALWPNLAGKNLPFSVADPWGRRYQIFSDQNFPVYIQTKFRIQCNIWSSNQTGAIQPAKFQNWVSAKWILIGLFLSNSNFHWVMQTNRSAWSVTMGGAMGGTEADCCGFLGCCAVPSAKHFLKFRLWLLFCWVNTTTLPRIKSENTKLKACAN